MSHLLPQLHDETFVRQLQNTDHRRPRRLQFNGDHLQTIEALLLCIGPFTGRDPNVRADEGRLREIGQRASELAALIDQQTWYVHDAPPSLAAHVLPGCEAPFSLIGNLQGIATAIAARPPPRWAKVTQRGRPLVSPTMVLLVNRLAEVYRSAGGHVAAKDKKCDFADFLRLLAEFLPRYLHSHINEDRVGDWFARFAKSVRKDLRGSLPVGKQIY